MMELSVINELPPLVQKLLETKAEIIKKEKRAVGEGIYNIGKELTDVHDNVLEVKVSGNKHKKHWQAFLKEVEIPRTSAFEFMTVYKLLNDTKQVSVKDYNKLVNNTKPNSLFQLAKMKDTYNIDILNEKCTVVDKKGVAEEVALLELSVRDLKALNKQLSEDNEELTSEVNKLNQELRIEKNKTKPSRATEENTEIQQLYENYRVLSEELKHTQEKLAMYESTEGHINIEDEDTGYVEAQVVEARTPELVQTLNKMTTRFGHLTDCKGGYVEMDEEMLDELSLAVNNAQHFLEKLVAVVNNEL